MLNFLKRTNEKVKSLSKKKRTIIVLMALYLVIAIAVSEIVITNSNTINFTQIVILFAITFGVVIVTILVDFFRLYRKYGDDKVTEIIALLIICLLIALIAVSWYAVIRYDMMYLLKRFFF